MMEVVPVTGAPAIFAARKMQREGVFREMKLRGHYEKPSERRVREKAEDRAAISCARACGRGAKKRIGAIVILGADRRIVGILSERDIVRAIAERGAYTLSEPVSVANDPESVHLQ
jgi:CBS domain-containing protein